MALTSHLHQKYGAPSSICMNVFWVIEGVEVILFVAGNTGLQRHGLAGLTRFTREKIQRIVVPSHLERFV